MAFDLTQNAFALLGAHPRDNRVTLDDTFQDALLDTEGHKAEAALHQAQQSLVSPRERLENELGFFISTKPATVRTIVAGLKKSTVAASASDLAGLDLINLLAHLCGTGEPRNRSDCAKTLLARYDSIKSENVATDLNAVRAVSGFGTLDIPTVRVALNRLTDLHAAAALDALLSQSDGSAYIAEIAGHLSKSASSKRSLLEALLRDYETRMSGDLDIAADKARTILHAIDANPEAKPRYKKLALSLKAWNKLVHPLQVADRSRGIDERHSQALFGEIRTVCLNFANDRSLYQQALEISKIAANNFSELPDATEKLRRDIATLSDLADQAARATLLEPLAEAVAAAEKRPAITGTALRKSGFVANAPDPVGAMVTAFMRILAVSNDRNLQGMGARMVRNLGIDLCNAHDDNHAAMAIVTGLVQHKGALPADVVQMLEADYQTLRKNIGLGIVTEAMKRGDIDHADRAVGDLLQGAYDETRALLLSIRAGIADRRKKRNHKRIGWAIFAGIVLLLIVSGKSSTSGPSYTTPANVAEANDNIQIPPETVQTEAAQAQSVPEAPPVDNGLAAAGEDNQDEMAPLPYRTGNTVSLQELRYCRRQKARLEAVQNDPASNAQMDRYNAAIADYNSRCSSFRYLQTDMDRVDGEIASDQANLRTQGLNIIGSEQ